MLGDAGNPLVHVASAMSENAMVQSAGHGVPNGKNMHVRDASGLGDPVYRLVWC